MSTNITMLETAQQSPRSILRRLVWVAPSAMVLSTVVNLILYALAGRLFPEVGAWPGAGPAQIGGANFVYLLAGAIALLVVSRFSSRPARHFLIGGVVALVLSFALPVSAGLGNGAAGTPPASAATVITLSLMHAVSFAIAVPLYIRMALT